MKSAIYLRTTLCLSLASPCAGDSSTSYAIVVSQTTIGTPGWSNVVIALE
jgi:hypothetical protein